MPADAAVAVAEAVREMRVCGLDDPQRMLEHANPAAIVATCKWWRGRTGVGTGLLVSKIRAGGIEEPPVLESPAARARQRFAQHAGQFPAGSVIESHARLQARRWPEDDLCSGVMVVFEAVFPNLAAVCGECGFEVGYSLRALESLGLRVQPGVQPEERAA